MSTPTAVFLDTSVLDGQQYNFSSTALKTFIPAAKKAGLKLLLPDPTEREIQRHIKKRSQEALTALDEARRRAPFLEKWKSFPKAGSFDGWEVTTVAREEWSAFLRQFDVIKLGYESVDVKTVMNWYDRIAAPFGEGKKRKEFPDAFAVAILEAYAAKHNIFIAVVAEDPDFKRACERFTHLLHFQTVPRLTELLLSTEDNVAKLHAAIDANLSLLTSGISDELASVSFYHEDERFEIVDTSLSEPSADEISIVAIGGNECTITFESSFEAEHQLRWEEDDSGGRYPSEQIREWINDSAGVSGTAKVIFDSKTGQLSGVTYVELDQDEFGVSKIPYHAPRLYR